MDFVVSMLVELLHYFAKRGEESIGNGPIKKDVPISRCFNNLIKKK